MKKIKIVFQKYIEDIFIISGLGLIIIATFILSEIAGLYCFGTILFGIGVYFSRNLPERR